MEEILFDQRAFRAWLLGVGDGMAGYLCSVRQCPVACWLSEAMGESVLVGGPGIVRGEEVWPIPEWVYSFVNALDASRGHRCVPVGGWEVLALFDTRAEGW